MLPLDGLYGCVEFVLVFGVLVELREYLADVVNKQLRELLVRL
jgi:hypothetical protein